MEETRGSSAPQPLNEQVSDWTLQVIKALRARLGIRIQVHREGRELQDGKIFLFNHFARFETFIPQSIIREETGAFCRSVASRELFKKDTLFSSYLLSIGAVPNNYERLLPFLAEEILRGRKVIVFPEGGMVKDRKVFGDSTEQYLIYSRSARERRPHHSGPAVLSLTLDAFKVGLSELLRQGNRAELNRWADKLAMSPEILEKAIQEPTLVVPSNITFHPIRVDQNILSRGAELLGHDINPQLAEELLIEGNLLFRETDMDIRLSEPVASCKQWNWMERKALAGIVGRMEALDDLFDNACQTFSWRQKLTEICIHRYVPFMRDRYMQRMYGAVTINMSHLAACLMRMRLKAGKDRAEIRSFDRTLYLAVKHAQGEADIHLHHGIDDPDHYLGIFEGKCPQVREFIDSCVRLGLIERRDGCYTFLPKLALEADFDVIRMDNPVAVYANEMAPVAGAVRAVTKADKEASLISDRNVAKLRFDDELRSLAWDRKRFNEVEHAAINAQETATEDPSPYLLVPARDKANGIGVLLVHGFLASPAELREFGQRLCGLGYTVMGLRLKGHGTSPHDLSTRTWRDWWLSVRRGYGILEPFVNGICLIGFSTGGVLSLIHAAEQPGKLIGVAVAGTPLYFRNKNLIFVPLIYRAAKLMNWMAKAPGAFVFRPNESEHPHINYRNIPIPGLYQLRLAVSAMKRRLDRITAPTLILQGDGDQVVDPVSADTIRERMSAAETRLIRLRADRHGILNENLDGAQDHVIAFLESLSPHSQGRDPTASGLTTEAAE